MFDEKHVAELRAHLDEARAAGAWSFAGLQDEEGRSLARSGSSRNSAVQHSELAVAAFAARRDAIHWLRDEPGLDVVRLNVGTGRVVLACFDDRALLVVEHDLARTTPEEVDRVIGLLVDRLRITLARARSDAALAEDLAWIFSGERS